MEENNTGFSEFAEAFGVEGDYQTGDAAAEHTEETTTDTEGTAQEAQEAPAAEETEDAADGQENEESGAEETSEAVNPIPEQKFAIKVDKETREVGIEELKTLAQKGAAFDRAKEQLTEARQTVQTLQAELDSNKPIAELVRRVAKDISTTPEELLKRVQVNWRMSKGETEKEALARIEAAEANRKLEALAKQQKPAQESAQDRAKREVAEFREKYPDVEITPELMKAVGEDVQKGVSLSEAYQKVQAAKKDAEVQALKDEIAKLQKQMEADKQNKKNRATSPGSQRDSGGQANKSEFDDFLSAFGK
jgi:hypothetical protein